MKRITRLGLVVSVIGCSLGGSFAANSGGPAWAMDWNTLDGGGGELAGPNGFAVHGTVGQHDVGEMSATNGFAISGGFWPGASGDGPVDTCPADISGDGSVDVTDMLAVLAAWGTSDPSADIAPPGGDGNVDVGDLLLVLASWGLCP